MVDEKILDKVNLTKTLTQRVNFLNAFRESINSIKNLVKKKEGLTEVDKSEVVGFLSQFSGYEGLESYRYNNGENNKLTQMQIIYDKLDQDSEEISSKCNDLVKIIEEELGKISDFLNRKSFTVDEFNELFNFLVINFQKRIYNVFNQITLKLGENNKLTESEFELVKENEEKIVLRFIDIYVEFENNVLNKEGKDMRWNAIYIGLGEIKKLLSRVGSKTENFLGILMDTITSKKGKIKGDTIDNCYTFCSNYLKARKTFEDYIIHYQKSFKSPQIYSEIAKNEDQKKEIDKLLSNSLNMLFNGIDNVKKVLDENRDKDDDKFKKLKDEYLKTFQSLNSNLSNNKKYKFDGALIDCEISGLSHIENRKIILSEFNKNYLKPEFKTLIEEVTQKLKDIINDKFLEQFKNDNLSNFPEKTNEASGNDEDLNKRFKAIEEAIDKIHVELTGGIGQLSVLLETETWTKDENQIISNKFSIIFNNLFGKIENIDLGENSCDFLLDLVKHKNGQEGKIPDFIRGIGPHISNFKEGNNYNGYGEIVFKNLFEIFTSM